MAERIEVTAVRSEPWWVQDSRDGQKKVAVIVDMADEEGVVLVMTESVGLQLARLFVKRR